MRPTTNEADLLKHVDPSLYSDDWPQFLLVNAEVTDPESGTLENLLVATGSSPLVVTGRLERLDSGEQQLRTPSQSQPTLSSVKKASAARANAQAVHNRDALPSTVTVPNVQQFSYGQYDDGEYAFWAAGSAGWFEIRPSRRYKSIFKDMTEVINCLYFTADALREFKGRKRATVTIDYLLKLYANEPSFRCPDDEHARLVFLRHRTILLELMREGKEGINWVKTSVYKYLRTDPSKKAEEDEHTPSQATPAIGSDDEDAAASLASKGKSALRPTGSRHSNKGKGRAATKPGDDPEDDIVSEVQTEPSSSPLKRRADKSSEIRPINKKQRVSQDQSSRKNSQSIDVNPIGDSDEPINPFQDPATNSLSARRLPLNKPDVSRTNPQLPRKHPPSSRPNEPRVDIIEMPLPSFEATLPGDVWQCSFMGCCRRVYGASSDDSKELIKEHYKKHAEESQERLDLVHSEERPYLPVGSLVKRIRELAAAQQAGEGGAIAAAASMLGMGMGSRHGNGQGEVDDDGMESMKAQPQPIKQRY